VRLAGIVAALVALLVLFWWQLSGDPSISQLDLYLNLGLIALSLGLTVALQEMSRRDAPLSRVIASLGEFLGVVVLLAAGQMLRVSSVHVAPQGVLCLGVLAGTLVTLGVLGHAARVALIPSNADPG